MLRADGSAIDPQRDDVPRRKPDGRDAERIAQLPDHRLVRPSFVPPSPIRQLGNQTRCRGRAQGDRTRDVGRLEKLLEDVSIKFSVVASYIVGVSSRAMLGAMVAGQRDPVLTADLAESQLRSKIPDLVEALTVDASTHGRGRYAN